MARTIQQRRFIKRIGKCEYCSKTEDLTIDHKIARCFGGERGTSNWQVLCYNCNHKKAREEHILFTLLINCYAPHLLIKTRLIHRKNYHGLPITSYSNEEIKQLHTDLIMVYNDHTKNNKRQRKRLKNILFIEKVMQSRGMIKEGDM